MSQLLQLAGKQEVAANTLEVSFYKPHHFDYLPGQNINLKLTELYYEDAKGPRRTFTLASAPHEDRLFITTRLTGSGYKKTLADLPLDAFCEYLGPQGKFVYDKTLNKSIWLAGGIGITPFRSMLVYAVAQRRIPEITLFYSNSVLAAAAYHDLFIQTANRYKSFRYVPILTNLSADDPWPGERRLLDHRMIAEYEPQWQAAVFYVCGPPAMVKSLSEQLILSGLAPQQIRTESLWGY